MVCMVAIIGGKAPTIVKLRGQRRTHKEDYDSLVNGRQYLDRAEIENRALVKPKNREDNHPSMILKTFNQTQW